MKQISQISTAKELNKVLLDTLVDLKNGEMDAQIAKGVAALADKVNKNNINILQYKRITQQPEKIDFFE